MRTRTLRKWFQVGGLAVAGLGLTGCGLTQQHQSPMPPQARMQTPPTTGASVMNASASQGNCWRNACATGTGAATLATTATPPAPDFDPRSPVGPAPVGPAGAINAPVARNSNPATFGGPQAPATPTAANDRDIQPVTGSGKSGSVVPADLKTTSSTLPLEGRQTGPTPGNAHGELPLANSTNRAGNSRAEEVVMPPPPPPIPISAANGPSPMTMSQATPLPSSAASGMLPPPPPPVPNSLPGLAPPPASPVTVPNAPTLPMVR